MSDSDAPWGFKTYEDGLSASLSRSDLHDAALRRCHDTPGDIMPEPGTRYRAAISRDPKRDEKRPWYRADGAFCPWCEVPSADGCECHEVAEFETRRDGTRWMRRRVDWRSLRAMMDRNAKRAREGGR